MLDSIIAKTLVSRAPAEGHGQLTELDKIDALFDLAMVVAAILALAILGFGSVAGLRWLGLDISYWWAFLPFALPVLMFARALSART